MARLTYRQLAKAVEEVNATSFPFNLMTKDNKDKGDAAIEAADLAECRKHAAALRKVVNDLDQLLEGTAEVDGDVAEFSEFFQTVAFGVVEAQRKLDRESAAYLEEIRDHRYLQPTTFRIPKVSAEIKFGFQSVAGTKLNLIFYSDTAEKTSRNEQSMRFDIVAAPLSPEARVELDTAVAQPRAISGGPRARGALADAAVAVAPAPPAVSFVLAPVRRRRLFEAVTGWTSVADRAGNREAAVVHHALLARPNRVLVVEAGADQYYLLVANPGNIKNIGLWRLTLDDEPSLLPAYRYTTKPERAEEEALAHLHPALVTMCDRQEALLSDQ